MTRWCNQPSRAIWEKELLGFEINTLTWWPGGATNQANRADLKTILYVRNKNLPRDQLGFWFNECPFKNNIVCTSLDSSAHMDKLWKTKPSKHTGNQELFIVPFSFFLASNKMSLLLKEEHWSALDDWDEMTLVWQLRLKIRHGSLKRFRTKYFAHFSSQEVWYAFRFFHKSRGKIQPEIGLKFWTINVFLRYYETGDIGTFLNVWKSRFWFEIYW